MERLTKKLENGCFIQKLDGVMPDMFDKLGKLEDVMEKYNKDDVEDLDIYIGKLKDLVQLKHGYIEDLLQENQELKKQIENNVPCKNGDIIYYICFPTMTVNEYTICDLKIETFTTNYQNDGWLMSEYGSSWFLTEEEAQQKLKEIRGE